MSLQEIITNIINWLIQVLGNIISTVLMILPDSPFLNFSYSFDNSFLKSLNFVFPVNSAITHLGIYVIAVIVYYILRVLMRWIKLASS